MDRGVTGIRDGGRPRVRRVTASLAHALANVPRREGVTRAEGDAGKRGPRSKTRNPEIHFSGEFFSPADTVTSAAAARADQASCS